MNKKMKIVAILAALVLVIGIAAGSTLAWLMDESDEVTNTFTMGNIEITLAETASSFDDEDGNANTNTYKMVPGGEIDKDPKVTVMADSEECWLFVEITKKNDFDTFMTYEIASGWTPLTDTNADGIADDGVYYRKVTASNANQEFPVLNGDKVIVSEEVTKEMFAGLDQDHNGSIETSELPALTFTAYAIQTVKFDTASDAWTEISNPTP